MASLFSGACPLAADFLNDQTKYGDSPRPSVACPTEPEDRERSYDASSGRDTSVPGLCPTQKTIVDWLLVP